ncbi:MAG: hypothetical protein M3P18_05805, partial [Actinomycetota bacterium]|nr:hypothetical protein [Actinomycetota bacterium]
HNTRCELLSARRARSGSTAPEILAGLGNSLIEARTRSHVLQGVGWSAAFLFVSRLSSVLAVPLVLHSLGPALYSVWVMGGVLIMVQSLFDLGLAAASIRFVAIAAARASRPAVLTVFWRSLLFYVALSLVVAVPLWIFAPELSEIIPSLQGRNAAQAVALLRYVGVAFGLTNVTLVLASVLQGIDRVDAAYRGQTIGWLFYVPLLAIGLRLGSPIEAVGLAWVCAFSIQVVVLAVDTWFAVAGLPRQKVPAPSLRQMLSLGGWLQLSSWADFATFQLPRLAGGFVLSPSALISLDVAMRAAQLVVAPLFAVYPLVLPTVAKLWTLRGADGLRAFLDRWFVAGAIALALFSVPFIPLEGPALAAWTGRPIGSFNLWLNGAVLLGVVAHASTGLFSSACLAVGDVRAIVSYKRRQLLAALVLILPAMLVGAVAVGFALGLALLGPALEFNRKQINAFRLTLPSSRSPLWLRLGVGLILELAGLSALTTLLRGTLPAWAVASITFPLWVGGCAAASIWCWRYWAEQQSREADFAAPNAGRAVS